MEDHFSAGTPGAYRAGSSWIEIVTYGRAPIFCHLEADLDTHTAAICDARGRVISQLQVPATTAGYVQLLAQVRSAATGGQVIWAVEGTRHYGLGLARHLASRPVPTA